VIYLSNCFANAKPDCPINDPKTMAKMLKEKTGIEVILGTHDYQ